MERAVIMRVRSSMEESDDTTVSAVSISHGGEQIVNGRKGVLSVAISLLKHGYWLDIIP